MRIEIRLTARLAGFLALAVLSALPGSAQSVSAPSLQVLRPLIELEARGRETTTVDIPFCDIFCQGLNPRFLSYRIFVSQDGFVSASLSVNELDEPGAGTTTHVFDGRGPAEVFQKLLTRLREARIGAVEGGCTVVYATSLFPEGAPSRTIFFSADQRIVWYGQGKRINRFDLPLGQPNCPRELRLALSAVLEYAGEVLESNLARSERSAALTD
jgi:hypothetical protein